MLSPDVEAHGQVVVLVVQRWHHTEKRQNTTTTNVENESEQSLKEP